MFNRLHKTIILNGKNSLLSNSKLMVNMARNITDELLELGKAKQNYYFLKKHQLELRERRQQIRGEERALTALIRENKRKIREFGGKIIEDDCLDGEEGQIKIKQF